MAGSEEVVASRAASQCLVAIGRLQVTSSPNSNDLLGANGNTNEFISRHSVDGKFTFVDQRYVRLVNFIAILACSKFDTCCFFSFLHAHVTYYGHTIGILLWAVSIGVHKCCWFLTGVVFVVFFHHIQNIYSTMSWSAHLSSKRRHLMFDICLKVKRVERLLELFCAVLCSLVHTHMSGLYFGSDLSYFFCLA